MAASTQIIKRGAASAAGCVEGLRRFAQGATAPAALRVVVSPSRAISIIMPPFGGHVHIEYHNHSYPRTHRLRWMASHWIRGSRGSPMNPVRLHTLRHFVASSPKGDARTLRDLPFCIIWHEKHYVDQPPPVAFPPLVPYGTTFPPRYRSGDKRKAPLWAG